MRIDPSIPRFVLLRRVVACDPVRVAVFDLNRCCGDGSIRFSKHLEKHNREDRVDLNRTALPLFWNTPGAPLNGVGGTLDVLG